MLDAVLLPTVGLVLALPVGVWFISRFKPRKGY